MTRRVIASLIFYLFVALLVAPTANANEKPVIISFDISPNEVDLVNGIAEISTEISISHPNGISNNFLLLTISDGQNISYSTQIKRADTPIDYSSKNVVFSGKVKIPSNFHSGVYQVSFTGVKNSLSAGYQYETGEVIYDAKRNLISAEKGLLVRINGKANLTYETLIGPSYESNVTHQFKNPTKYNNENSPIWKKGEVIDLTNYFESPVPEVGFAIKSSTPEICISEKTLLKLLNEGICKFKAFSDANDNYKYAEIFQEVVINKARLPQVIKLDLVPTQTSSNLPKKITIPNVVSTSGDYVLPNSLTPAICSASGFTLTIFSGGICELSYFAKGNSNFLDSEKVVQKIEISRDPQTLIFNVPPTAIVGAIGLALSSTVSSSGTITYSASPSNVCSLSGTILNFKGKGTCQVTASQSGTTTIEPVSVTKLIEVSSASEVKKTITCVKGTKRIKTIASKCPKGYKKR